jgi:hypothetical protein
LPYCQAAKNEEWEEKNKLANQFRALEEDEIMLGQLVWLSSSKHLNTI